ncbi:MAG: AsmA family protein, partial [Pseudomonas sp.]
MKSFGKILGLFFLGVLLILVALGFALTHLFDPNDYKDEIRQLARDKANLELTLNGDIGWSLFPWLGLELHDATLASATTPEQPFADLRMIGLSVRVLPLLRREVQMSDIKVDGLNLTLTRDEQGHGNWQDIGRPAKPAASTDQPATTGTPAPTNESTADAKPSSPVKLDIDSLTLANTRIDYKDAKSGKQFSAEGIELSTGAIREGANIPVKLTAFLGTNQPVLRAKTEVAGVLRFDRALKRYQFEDLKLSGEASGEPLNGKTLTFAAQGQLLLDQGAQIAEWNGLKLSANQLRALGELNVRELDKEPQLTGGLSIAEFNLREFLEGIGRPVPAMANANALSKVELVSRLQGNANSLALNELKLKVDESAFTGSLAVTDLAKQALSVQLKGDKLNLDSYLPPKNKDNEQRSSRQNEVSGALASAGKDGNSDLPNPPSQQAWSEEPVLPIDQLRKVTAEVNIGLGLLTVDKLPIENASIKANGKDGLLTLENMRGELYNGNFNATASLDVRPAV